MNELEPTFLASKIEKGIDSVIEKSIDDTALEDYSGSGKSENTLAAVLEGSKDSNATSENPEAYGFNLITLLENPVRTEREAWYIYSRLKNFRFFTQFIENGDEKDKLDSAMYICKKLQYHKHSAGSVIMKQNQYSNGKVYLILSGELLVITADMTGLANTTEQDQTERRGTICEPKEIDKIQIVINESDPNEESPVPRRRRSSVKLNLESHNTLLLPEPTTMTSRKSSLFRELALSPQASSSKPRATINLGQSSGFSDNLNQIVQSQKKQDFLRKPQTMVINMNQRAKMLKKQTKIDLDRAMVNPDPYGKVVNKIGKGAYFGEKALFTRHKRSATIMANSEVELLTLNQEEFEYVQTEFNKTKKQLLNFISGIFPKLEKLHPVTIENLSYTCDIKNCFFHQTIISEGTRGDEFFIVYDGKLEVMKTLIYDKSDTLNQNMAETKNLYGLKKTAKEQFVIMTMEKGMFFGEEILYDIDPVYEYTVRVSTEKTRLLCFKKSKFLFKCPKKIIDSLQTVYLNKKQRINKTMQTRLEKRGTKASLELLEDFRPVIAFPKTQASYGPNLHQTNRQSSIILPPTIAVSKPSLSEIKLDLGTHLSLSKSHQTIAKSVPKLLRLDLTKNGDDDVSPRASLNNYLSASPHAGFTSGSGSLSPVGGKSLISSPRREKPMILPKYNFKISHSERNLNRKRENRIGSVGTADPSEIQEVETYINNIHNFKNDFGKTDKEIEKKYKSLKVRQGIIKTNTRPIPLSDYNGNISLAQFVTKKLKQKNFISPMNDHSKNILDGFPDVTTEQLSLRRSQSSLTLQKINNSPRIKPTDEDFSQLGQTRNSNSVDLRKFKFMLKLDQQVPDFSEPDDTFNIHTRKRGETTRALSLSKKAPFDSTTVVLKTTRSHARVESPKKGFSPPIIKMDTHYASGFSWKALKSARNSSPRGSSSSNFLKLISPNNNT